MISGIFTLRPGRRYNFIASKARQSQIFLLRAMRTASIIAAPEGIKALSLAHPDVQIYVGNLDRCLNENAYICPGLGDAGDRIFGTK